MKNGRIDLNDLANRPDHLHITTLAIIAATFGVCAYIILARTFSSDMDKLAAALLTAIVTGLVGYVTGRASK